MSSTEPDIFAREHRARAIKLDLERLVLAAEAEEHAARQRFEQDPTTAAHAELAVASQRLRNAQGDLESHVEQTRAILEEAPRERDRQRLEELKPLVDWRKRTAGKVDAVEALLRSFLGSIVPLANAIDAELQGAFVASREENDISRRLGLTNSMAVNRMSLAAVLKPLSERLQTENQARNPLGGLRTVVGADDSPHQSQLIVEFRAPYSKSA